MTFAARLMVHDDGGPDPVDEALSAEFGAAGLTLQTLVLRTHRAETFTWVAIMVVPLTSFLDVMARDATGRLVTAIRGLIGRLSGKRAPTTPRTLVLQDERTGLQILLEPDLPPSAYAALTTLDLTQYKLGPLHYDQSHHRWRSTPDEATTP